MFETLYSLLQDSLDYAGIYPPAKLSLDQAIQNYNIYRKQNEAWILSRFVIGTHLLSDLLAYKDSLLSQDPFYRFTVLCQKIKDISSFRSSIQTDMRRIEEFIQTHDKNVKVEFLELQLPNQLDLNRSQNITKFLDGIVHVIEKSDVLEPIKLFIEPVYLDGESNTLNIVTTTLNKYNRQMLGENNKKISFGFKLRSGGLNSKAIPSSTFVTTVIKACHDSNLALKATAGLHHPIYHHDPHLNTFMHGFINIIGVTLLNHAFTLPSSVIQQVIETQDPNVFHFDNERFTWNNEYSLTTNEIIKGRKEAFISFGSCDFVDPRADLQKLGYDLNH